MRIGIAYTACLTLLHRTEFEVENVELWISEEKGFP